MSIRKLLSGHTTKEISEHEKEDILRDFSGLRKYYEIGEHIMRAEPGGWFLPSSLYKFSDHTLNIKWRPDDVLIVTYPKCGTGWIVEIIWTMLHNRDFKNPLQDLFHAVRCPFLEYEMLLPYDAQRELRFKEMFERTCSGQNIKDGAIWQMAEKAPSPRVICTHLPVSFFQNDPLKTCKVICVARNPKDVVLSWHHFQRFTKNFGYQGNLDNFINYFIQDKLIYSPFWGHLKECWNLKDNQNMFFLFYEQLKGYTKEMYTRIANFIQADLNSSQIEKIMEFTSFDAMKNRVKFAESDSQDEFVNKDVIKKDGGYFKKGEAGSWKEELSPMQVAKLDQWIEENSKRTGINFS